MLVLRDEVRKKYKRKYKMGNPTASDEEVIEVAKLHLAMTLYGT